MLIQITEQEKEFILKALWNISILYDFESTTEKEFLKDYGISKSDLKKLSVVLSDKVRE